MAEAFVGKLKERNLCKSHKQPVILFCDEYKCQVAICALCIPEDHAKHEVIKIESKVIGYPDLQRLKDLKEKIVHRRKVLDQAHEDVHRIGDEALAILDERYTELSRQLLKLHKDVTNDIVREIVSSSVMVRKGERKLKEVEDTITEYIEGYDTMEMEIREDVHSDVKYAELLLGLENCDKYDMLNESYDEYHDYADYYAIPMMAVVDYEVGKTELYTNDLQESLFGTVDFKCVDLPTIQEESPSSPGDCSEAQPEGPGETVSQNTRSRKASKKRGQTTSKDGRVPSMDVQVNELHVEFIKRELRERFFFEDRRSNIEEDRRSDIAFDWIEFNIRKEYRSDLVFVSSLVEIICRSCIKVVSEENYDFRIDRKKLQRHITGLKRTCLTCTSCPCEKSWGPEQQTQVIHGIEKAIEGSLYQIPPDPICGDFIHIFFTEGIIDYNGGADFLSKQPEIEEESDEQNSNNSESDWETDNDTSECESTDLESDSSYWKNRAYGLI